MQKILLMIQKINNRLEENRSTLYCFRNAKYFDLIRLNNNEIDLIQQMQKNAEIKIRLVKYYEEHLYQLTIEAFRHGIIFSKYLNEEQCI
jgi:hypothetical protein